MPIIHYVYGRVQADDGGEEEGRMRIIDADEFISEMKELYQYAGWDKRDVHFSLMDTINNIEVTPTVEAIPIEWILLYIQEYPYMTASSMLHYWSLDQAIEEKERKEE